MSWNQHCVHFALRSDRCLSNATILGGVPTTIEFFQRSELRYGDEVLTVNSGTVGGMRDVLKHDSVEAIPLLVATSCPSGPLTADCYNQLKTELLERLERELPVDGVLLALHGSASADGVGDVEGELLSAVRHVVGAATPVVGTLDLHAHVTKEMVRAANALVAWETYPHRDAFETGQRGARMLMGTLKGEFHPTMALSKAPVIVGGVNGSTEDGSPFCGRDATSEVHRESARCPVYERFPGASVSRP